MHVKTDLAFSGMGAIEAELYNIPNNISALIFLSDRSVYKTYCIDTVEVLKIVSSS